MNTDLPIDPSSILYPVTILRTGRVKCHPVMVVRPGGEKGEFNTLSDNKNPNNVTLIPTRCHCHFTMDEGKSS